MVQKYAKIAKIRLLTVFRVKVKSIRRTNMFFVVVNVAHCQQVGTAGSKRQGYTSKWNASVHIDCIT